MEILEVLNKAFELKASDIFIVGGLPITYKVFGKMVKEEYKPTIPEIEDLVKQLYTSNGRPFKEKEDRTEDDFSFSLPGIARFRCNVFYQRGSLSAVIRMLQFGIPNPAELNIPNELLEMADLSKGMVLVAGATGSGKSTTIACIIDRINHLYAKNIITMEDPIEFLHRHNQSIVIQREVPTDTPSFKTAMRSALRETPDVLFVGEMRDNDTMSIAMTAAEAGRLVISTLHTMSAADTIDRVIDSFPGNEQNQIRTQLSRVLKCVICQQLVPGIDGKLYPAFEILKVTPAVQNLIREGKTFQIPSVIQTGRSLGMRTMKSSIDELVMQGLISRKTAMEYYEELEDNFGRL